MSTVLETKDLSKMFSQGILNIEVLKSLNLRIDSGETVAVLGESGSGKSTLLSLLTGLDRPTQGSVLVDGTDLGTLTENQVTHLRAQKMGIVFQQFHLMSHLTAIENVSLPLEILRQENTFDQARDLLAKVRLSHRIGHFPDQLSGGECQRVAIARALVTRPAILLADEPTGNLDPGTARDIVQLFFDLVKETGTTLLMVTHSSEVAARCSRRLMLREGSLKAL